MSGPALSSYAVDLDELLEVADELGRRGEALDALLDHVSGRVAALHRGWSGEAAAAQARAQAAWEEGFREMGAALAAMRAAARAAHEGNAGAAAANVQRWQQLG